MRIDRGTTAPICHDSINAAPERKVGSLGPGNMIEQSHPKHGERLVIKIAYAMMLSESANVSTHSFERLIDRRFCQVARRHCDMGGVREF